VAEQPRQSGRQVRWGTRIVVAIVAGATWIALGAGLPPRSETCDRSLAADVCHETIDAALRRGLPPVHPLLLAAHAEPGPAARPDQLGHRATVTFGVLGMPGDVRVRLYFDAGGHWGGVVDRGVLELAAWALAQGLLLGAGIGGGALMLGRHRPKQPSTAA